MTGRGQGQLGIEGLFEARGRIGSQAETARGPADRRRLEGRDLEQQGIAPLGDLGVVAAHDARQRHGRFAGADQEVGRAGLAIAAVEGSDRLARARIADDDAASGAQ